MLPTLPAQPAGTPWPTEEWPEGRLEADRERLDPLIARAFAGGEEDALGETHALVAVHRGRLVAEHYANSFGPDVTYPSWSKAKSVTQALVGILAGDGQLLHSGPEQIIETYYSFAAFSFAALSLDYQFIVNPAYNRDRGPVSVFGVRTHIEF